ncbi:hypothetical protein [Neobacillus sp. LXY-4]
MNSIKPIPNIGLFLKKLKVEKSSLENKIKVGNEALRKNENQ